MLFAQKWSAPPGLIRPAARHMAGTCVCTTASSPASRLTCGAWGVLVDPGPGWVVGCSWESTTLGPLCVVPPWGSPLLSHIGGARALKEGSFWYGKGVV